VDWALLHDRKALCIVEAKALDVTLGDREIFQAVNYAQAHNVEWAVLTNGRVLAHRNHDRTLGCCLGKLAASTAASRQLPHAPCVPRRALQLDSRDR